MTLSLYCLAAVLPYGLICLWLWRAGVWQKFWFWTVEYASQYVQTVPLSQAPDFFWYNFSGVAASNWPLWLLALAGVAGVAILGRGKPGLRIFAFGWLVFSFFCVCPSFYFRQHYFIAMLPAVAMFIGVGCRLLWDLACGRFWMGKAAAAERTEKPSPASAARQKRGSSKPGKPERGPRHRADSALCRHWWSCSCWQRYSGRYGCKATFLFAWNPLQACRETYGLNPFLECPVIASYLAKNTTPEATIAVLGSEPEIFFDARRNSATGYIYTYGMMEPQPLARRMQEEMVQEIEAARPQYIVFVNVTTSWLPRNTERFIFQWLQPYLSANYRRVGIVDILDADHTEYHWDSDAEGYQPRSQANLLVFRRN